MDEHIDYQVLAPDSVAWYIQAALVADRTGNETARDMALAEAQRVAQERKLVAEEPCYDCRTTGQRLDDLTERVVELERVNAPSVARADWMAEVERQLIQCRETNTRHRQMIDELAERLAALEKLSLATRIAYLENRAQGITGPDAGL